MPNTEFLMRRVLGSDIPRPARRPLTSIGVNFAALSVFATFFGPWLVGELGASAGQASAAYVVAGLAGVCGGYLGGRITDRFGPRAAVHLGAAGQVTGCAVLLLPGVGVRTACVVLVAVTFLQPLRGVAQRIALVDAAPDSRSEELFAGYRLIINVGTFAGPLLGAGLVDHSWWLLHLEVTALYALSLLTALRVPYRTPGAGAPAPGAPDAPGTSGAARPRRSAGLAMLGDWRLYALMLATTSAWTVVYAYETVLPIALTQSYGIAPATWGVVYSLGPVLVVLLQLRISRWTAGVAPRLRLAAGTAVMGAAFLVLPLSAAIGAVAVVVVTFLIGDMVWGPASEDAPLRLAPDAHRGAYVGVLTASIWLGSALAPGLGLPLRESYGDTRLWQAVFALALLSGAVYTLTDVLAARTQPATAVAAADTGSAKDVNSA
ncbi:MFS transporter [Streptomyces sp. 796.1]|uniref:MFS transporter n=1 Tax=Streptomyces sp. 796.1 TaxID=3163029 RepID=UPI0039C96BDF